MRLVLFGMALKPVDKYVDKTTPWCFFEVLIVVGFVDVFLGSCRNTYLMY